MDDYKRELKGLADEFAASAKGENVAIDQLRIESLLLFGEHQRAVPAVFPGGNAAIEARPIADVAACRRAGH
ncbi:hypothetical protein LLE87_32705, partial [Paenibacillus polymyxa]|nr:hypothetical protein [Paenibacillus polymyxa]